jgi:hypothetical protein
MENKAGNYFGSAVDLSELSAGTKGDLITYNASGVATAVSIGSTNDVLQVSAGLPVWASNVNAPIGSVLAWLKSFTNTPALPSNFVECNGQVLSDTGSVYNGQTIPDLNGSAGTGRFLRGKTTSGGTGGTETHHHSVSNSSVADGHGSVQAVEAQDTSDYSTLPSYYEVVWVMRIK